MKQLLIKNFDVLAKVETIGSFTQSFVITLFDNNARVNRKGIDEHSK